MLHQRAAVRGNLASFPVHWDDVLERLLAITKSPDGVAVLPHDEHTLAQLVRFEFRMQEKDISKHLKHMRLRAHVVLQLCLELIHREHPVFKQLLAKDVNAVKITTQRITESRRATHGMVHQQMPMVKFLLQCLQKQL